MYAQAQLVHTQANESKDPSPATVSTPFLASLGLMR